VHLSLLVSRTLYNHVSTEFCPLSNIDSHSRRWGHFWFTAGSIMYTLTAALTVSYPPTGDDETTARVLNALPWLNFVSALLFVIDSLVYGVDFWRQYQLESWVEDDV
jgi:hypothetical protein